MRRILTLTMQTIGLRCQVTDEAWIHHFKAALPMRTTSLVSSPRTKARERPSRDQSKAMICSALKSVSCHAGLPSSGWSQISAKPPGILANAIVFPFGDHRTNLWEGATVGGKSKRFRGRVPSDDTTPILQ